MTFYRHVKTLNLLHNLYLAEAINPDTFNQEVNQITQKMDLVRNHLQGYDLKRFCELWGIEVEYGNVGQKLENKPSANVRVGLSVARISNLLPQINDTVYPAENWGEIHEVLSTFCV